MACYSPLKGYDSGTKTINLKPKYYITSYDKVLYNPDGTEMEFIEIPCGRCIGCRLAYSRMWADRCVAEATLHEQSYFVTLTYNDEHLPYPIDMETGEILTQEWPTLRKRDVQLFMKRLRKNYQHENKIRFFLAGEYGEKHARPHYHLILFGLKLDDLKFYKKTPLGFNLYTSQWLNQIWQEQGHVIIADVTWETCAYTARYIMKKQTGSGSKLYEELNIKPEFTLMSRKPGIAKEFYEMNKEDFIKYGNVNISTQTGGRQIHSTKYFDKFLEMDYPIEVQQNKEIQKKRLAEIKTKKLAQTSLSYLELLQIEENKKRSSLKGLPRKEI